MEDYQVDLDSFRGPLDLLLYLVKHNEVDVCDIPIARILEQFQHYLEIMTVLDVERVGDFIVMAGTLMEIKSKLVLPRSAEESAEEEGDPRLELVRQLIEYKKFKDAAAMLETRAERQSLRLSRQPVITPSADPSRQPLQQVELWDLVSAFGRLMRETLALQPQQIVVDNTPIHVYMEQIVKRLESEGSLSFRALFTPPYNRGRLVGLFLAMLELIKGWRVVVEQVEPFAEITVALAPPAPESPAETLPLPS
jgi:segregation and condensation protein A